METTLVSPMLFYRRLISDVTSPDYLEYANLAGLMNHDFAQNFFIRVNKRFRSNIKLPLQLGSFINDFRVLFVSATNFEEKHEVSSAKSANLPSQLHVDYIRRSNYFKVFHNVYDQTSQSRNQVKTLAKLKKKNYQIHRFKANSNDGLSAIFHNVRTNYGTRLTYYVHRHTPNEFGILKIYCYNDRHQKQLEDEGSYANEINDADVRVDCNSDEIVVNIGTRTGRFNGMIYPRGLSKNTHCLSEWVQRKAPITYTLPLRGCNTMSTELCIDLLPYRMI
ncbi:hypothetical protein HUJ04_004866 [Dendroctonus ponderosae]|nr:hypothetical protein HUJ04_004866 [Dendroctonus ponderosae]